MGSADIREACGS